MPIARTSSMRVSCSRAALSAALVSFIISSSVTGALAASSHPTRARHGMVVSAEPLATDIGIEVLKAGGNAIDATVAVGFALSVTFPQAGNLAGGGFSIVRTRDGRTSALDFREKAPAAAHRDMYLRPDGLPDDALSQKGFRAAGVPGTVAGLAELHRKLGRLPLARLIDPAIRLASEGFTVPYSLARSLHKDAADMGSFPESRAVFFLGEATLPEGHLLRQPALATTLQAIRDGGPEAFYKGSISKEIARVMRESGGLITAEDLAAYAAVWREPVTATYRGFELASMPPPSSGGIILAQVLNMLEKEDLAALGFHSSQAVHLMAEAMRRSYRDRARLLGDPDFVSIDSGRLVSKEYAERLRRTIDAKAATSSRALDAHLGESPQTTHYCVVDDEGNAVATTYTLNGSYGCGRMIAGMLFNNEMDDFSTKPGHPNMYGLVGSEANSIQPGKRMLSSMTPTIVTRNGHLMGVVGSPGGSTIPTTVIQLLVNIIDYGFDIQEAIDLPRFHHQYLPDQIRLEETCLTSDGMGALRALGHELRIMDSPWGDAQGIWYDPVDKVWLGGSDSRHYGKASGY